MVPLTDSPNEPNNFGAAPIHLAEMYGSKEIVKILTPFPKNSHVSLKYGHRFEL